MILSGPTIPQTQTNKASPTSRENNKSNNFFIYQVREADAGEDENKILIAHHRYFIFIDLLNYTPSFYEIKAKVKMKQGFIAPKNKIKKREWFAIPP